MFREVIGESGGCDSLGSSLNTSFRRDSSRLVASLTRTFGPQHLGLAEDVVQETFLRAMRQWPIRGVPPNPQAWLSRVARNLAIDAIRRESIYADSTVLDRVASVPQASQLLDDELQMLFLCCSERLSEESQIALVLKTLCGLGVREIAKGLLSTEGAIAQRLVRAKFELRAANEPFEMPSEPELTRRLRLVLNALYLLFNEGYLAHLGPELTNSDLCDEAILLVSRLAHGPIGDRPETHALLALMLLHSSRLPARVDESGSLRLLEDQDRSKWDRARIAAGLGHLSSSARGERITPYHCEAAIAAAHCTAESFAQTDWRLVLSHYDDLLTVTRSPIAALNRTVAVRMVLGSDAALSALERIEGLDNYYLFAATRARFLEESGRLSEASSAYHQAIRQATNDAEIRFLNRRMGELHRREGKALIEPRQT